MAGALGKTKRSPAQHKTLTEAAAKAHAEAAKRCRDRIKAARFNAAGLPLPCDLVVPPIQKVGPKRKEWARLKLNSRWRRRARDAAAARLLLTLADEPSGLLGEQHDAHCQQLRQEHSEDPGGDGENAQVVAAAGELSQLSRFARREQRLLMERNPEGCRGLLEHQPEFVQVHERECGLLCDEPSRHVGIMRCCPAQVCKECLQEWFGRHQQDTELGYTEGVNRVVEDPTWVTGVSNFSAETRMSISNGWGAQERGRPLTKPMPTHHCPFCRTEHQTLSRAWDAARRAGRARA